MEPRGDRTSFRILSEDQIKIINMIQPLTRGIDVTKETLAIEVIRKVGLRSQ